VGARYRYHNASQRCQSNICSAAYAVPRRWVVERTFGWFGRYRGLSKDYEELPQSSEAMVLIAMIQVMLKRLEPP